MERKRDGLVPIREAFGGLDGGGLIPIGDALSGNAYSDRTIWWIRKRPVPCFLLSLSPSRIGLSPLQIQRRFTAAGIKARATAHSGRVGLASELTARGASTTEVMLAGNWRTSRMVAHYSAGATAERGAVAKYL